ncbi:zinc ABC transporter substrate-binding protein [Marinobacter pelagius]|uniref:zinc ABC transporter substrate-binding protein n=1 Tax=Marinobacter sp. C7 TaxID=2951363 RepID=UPI001EF10FCA|nr:zinc ABC transporter substrate-binding protein [Marinobacter sp. C7]MCG7199253.1 zinc ABC transporter substrate-binding protein [Marinobacter sp. C7]
MSLLSRVGRSLAPALFTATVITATPANAEVKVVTSIKPVELLVRAVATEDVQVTTLVPPGSSPHNYTMRPSQRRALENADLIFWVGPEMESFLIRLLSADDFRGRTIALSGEEIDGDEHHEEQEHDHGHDHGEGEDPHLWVDPMRGLEMARDIAQALVIQGGVNQQAINQNMAAFEAALTEREASIREQLAPAREIDVFAYHNALTRFAEHYELDLAGVLTLNPELSPGARHVAEVQNKLREASHPCLLTEPQFNRQWWRSITEGLNVTFSTWDPLAMDIDANRTGYLDFQQSVADAVLKCLPEDTQH